MSDRRESEEIGGWQREVAELRQQISTLVDLITHSQTGNTVIHTDSNRDSCYARSKIKPGSFDGTQDWSDYWYKFQVISRFNSWSSCEQAVQLTAALQGQALAIVARLGLNATCAEMVMALESRYGTKGQEHLFAHQLRVRRQAERESIVAFANELEALAAKAFAGAPAAVVEAMALQQFYDGLRDLELRRLVIGFPTTSFRSAVTYAVQAQTHLIRAAGTSGFSTLRRVEENTEGDFGDC